VAVTALRVVVTWRTDVTPVVWAAPHVDDVQLATLRVEGVR
jgi:hypothetical protein